MTGSRARLERVWALVIKEFLQVFRDPRLARLIFIAPIIQLVVFGYAVTTDIDNTSTFVVDHMYPVPLISVISNSPNWPCRPSPAAWY